MTRAATRIRIKDDGALEVVDPGFDVLPMLEAIDPAFRVASAPLPGFDKPRLLDTRARSCGLRASELASEADATLWSRHARLTEVPPAGTQIVPAATGSSVLDLKVELARRLLAPCELCAHRCGVDRTRGETGVCGLGDRALLAEHFVHIGEESLINPSLVLNLAGCGLRCRFCQQWRLLDTASVSSDELTSGLWSELDLLGARSISFVGGNPDESLPGILRFLADAPNGLALPIVWNSHAYATSRVLALLNGIVDAYVPDLKYASEECGRRLSGVRGYADVALASIEAMIAQRVPVVVRILVLPGHLDCCHRPALAGLAAMNASNLFVSIRDQYCPDWKVGSQDGELVRRVRPKEAEAVRAWARNLQLTAIE